MVRQNGIWGSGGVSLNYFDRIVWFFYNYFKKPLFTESFLGYLIFKKTPSILFVTMVSDRQMLMQLVTHLDSIAQGLKLIILKLLTGENQKFPS